MSSARMWGGRLVEEFGSTRRKRQLVAQDMAAVNADSIGERLATPLAPRPWPCHAAYHMRVCSSWFRPS